MTVLTPRDELELGLAIRDVGSPDQTEVVVVVTSRPGVHAPDFDVPAVEAAGGPDVRVVVVPAHLTAALKQRLGDAFVVYGGAARVFPLPREGAPTRAPLVKPPAGGRDTLERLLHEVRRAATDAAAPPPPAPGPPHATRLPVGTGRLTQIDTPELAAALAGHLLSLERTRPALLVTRRAGDNTPPVDVGRILADVGTLVDVFEMGTGEVSWAFARELAAFPGTECYGGAGRVYPVGREWTTNLQHSPLRFTWTDSQADSSTAALIRDALASSRLSTYSAQPSPTRSASGIVQGTVSGRGLVALEQGGMATIWPELILSDITADQLLRTGMRVTGRLDEESRRLDVSAALVPAATALAPLREGDLVTARVVAVERNLAILEIFPDVLSAVPAEEIMAGRFVVDVRQWLTEGEVVAARVRAVGEADDDWELSLLDVDPDARPLPAPPLLPDGPPWLPEPRPWDDEEEPEPAASEQPAAAAPVVAAAPTPVAEPRPEVEASLRAMTAERDALAREIERLQDDLKRANSDLGKLRSRAREREQVIAKITKQLEAKDKQLAGVEGILEDRARDLRAFIDPSDQFRYEVELEWARRIPAAEKPGLTRVGYRLGPEFLDSLAELTDRDRAKAVEVVIDVMTGRVYEMPGRQTHQMRTGPGGDDPYLTRPDGATCWRAALQQNTPQARRLHFWALGDGTVELSSVRLHDDMRA